MYKIKNILFSFSCFGYHVVFIVLVIVRVYIPLINVESFLVYFLRLKMLQFFETFSNSRIIQESVNDEIIICRFSFAFLSEVEQHGQGVQTSFDKFVIVSLKYTISIISQNFLVDQKVLYSIFIPQIYYISKDVTNLSFNFRGVQFEESQYFIDNFLFIQEKINLTSCSGCNV